jgi:transposase-like protein
MKLKLKLKLNNWVYKDSKYHAKRDNVIDIVYGYGHIKCPKCKRGLKTFFREYFNYNSGPLNHKCNAAFELH